MALPIVYHPDFVAPLPPEHRFPMPKFGLIYQMLVRNGLASIDQFHIPDLASVEMLELVHDAAYVRAFLAGELEERAMRRIGLPWSEALAHRTRAAVGGTVLTAQLALEHGLACSTAGGTHHAHAGFGSGYCIFNDLAVTARYLVHNRQVRRVLIIDLDVHQGDGTASIFETDRHVFTFSIHCGANFPFRKSISDLDVDLAVLTEDVEYLQNLQARLPALLDEFSPEIALYDAGVDPHVEDRLGKLALSSVGLYKRDRYVIEQCESRGIPIACVVGGGYDRDMTKLVRRHCILYEAAGDVFIDRRL